MNLEEGRQHVVMQFAGKSNAFVAPFFPNRFRGPAQRLVLRGNPLLRLVKSFGSNEASPRQRGRWELIGGGIGIHWGGVDEDISVASLLQPENFMRLPNKTLQPTSRVKRRRRKASGSGASRG